MKTNIKILLLCVFMLLIGAVPSRAQDEDLGVDILPADSLSEDSLYVDLDNATHPPVRLTPDRSELVRLDTEAGSIIIGNPRHLSILAESSKLIVLVPQAPGATYFTVLDRKGNVVMQRHVIVASPKEKYVRIRRSCAAASAEGCQETRVYYCPDMCHEIAISTEGADNGANMDNAAAAASALNQSAASSDTGDNGEEGGGE